MAEGTAGRRWVWVVAPHGYLDERGREHPALVPGRVEVRCCDAATTRGDLGVLYRSRRAKDVAYLLRAVSDAESADGGGPRCAVEVVERLPRPVPLAELRADPVTARWPALRASFVRRVAAVPPDVWFRVLDLAGSEHVAEPSDTG